MPQRWGVRTSTGGYATYSSVTCVSSSTLEYGAGRSRCIPWRRMYACFALLFEDHPFIPDALLILGCADELRQARRQLLVFLPNSQQAQVPRPSAAKNLETRRGAKEGSLRTLPTQAIFLFEISSIIALACCYP